MLHDWKSNGAGFVALAGLLCCLAPLADGCSRQPPVLRPEVRYGAGQQIKPARTLVLPASCGSMEARCPREYVDTVDGIVRSSMDFAGYTLISTDELKAETRQRHEEHETETAISDTSASTRVENPFDFDELVENRNHSETTVERSKVVLDGSAFEDLSVSERKAVLAEAGADGVLVVRIVMGAETGVWAPDQTVEVTVKLSVVTGDTMAWAARCSASSNDFSTAAAALENAARCAMDGATSR